MFLNNNSAVLFRLSISEQNVLQPKYSNVLYFDYEWIEGKLPQM